MNIKEAKQILQENGYSLMEVSDAEMFDKMWDETQLVNQFKTGKIEHLDKYQVNSVCHFLRRKCGDIVWKKLRDLNIKPSDMSKVDAGDYAAKYIIKSEDEIRNFLNSNPVTYFTPEILEIISKDWVEDGNQIDTEKRNKYKEPKKIKTKSWFEGEEL